MRVEIDEADGCFAVGTQGSVVLMLWRGAATRAQLAAASALVARHIGTTGQKVAVLTVIEPGAPPPDDPERQAVGGWMRELAPSIVAQALVLEGGGDDAEQVLNVGMRIDELRGVRMNEKFCFGAREAAVWIVGRCEAEGIPAPTRDELVRGVEELRAAIDRHG